MDKIEDFVDKTFIFAKFEKHKSDEHSIFRNVQFSEINQKMKFFCEKNSKQVLQSMEKYAIIKLMQSVKNKPLGRLKHRPGQKEGHHDIGHR